MDPHLKENIMKVLDSAHHELTCLHGMTAYDGSDNTKDGFIIDAGELCAHINSLLKELDSSRNDHDPINHPSHYNTGGIEVITFILDQKMDFLTGNIVKYLCRASHKGNQLEDLRKAQWYMNRLIDETPQS